MEYSSKAIKSLVNEMFDDITQKNNYIKGVANHDPFGSNFHNLVDVDKFRTKQIAKGTSFDDIHDIRHVIATKVIPIIEEVPHIMRLVTFDDSRPDRVTMILKFKVKKSIIQALFHLFVRNQKLIVKLEMRHHFDLNKLTPEEEKFVQTDKNVHNLSTSGEFLKVKYIPWQQLESHVDFEVPLDNKTLIKQHFMAAITGLNAIASTIKNSELP